MICLMSNRLLTCTHTDVSVGCMFLVTCQSTCQSTEEAEIKSNNPNNNNKFAHGQGQKAQLLILIIVVRSTLAPVQVHLCSNPLESRSPQHCTPLQREIHRSLSHQNDCFQNADFCLFWQCLPSSTIFLFYPPSPPTYLFLFSEVRPAGLSGLSFTLSSLRQVSLWFSWWGAAD